MDGPIVSVIIPSRLEHPVERPGSLLVEDALRPIRGQNGLPAGLRGQVVIGVDAAAAIPDAVEATAPVAFAMAIEVRPHLAAALQFGGPEVALARHRFDRPLVVRRVHPLSGTQRTAHSPEFTAESQREFERLKQRFGHIPC